jgi:RNA polymerase sigma-70 factor (ECF subfamily)
MRVYVSSSVNACLLLCPDDSAYLILTECRSKTTIVRIGETQSSVSISKKMSHIIELDRGNTTLQRSYSLPASRMSKIMQASASETVISQNLFRLFLDGDDSAFIQLYELHNQKIYVFCAKILRDSSAAKDITHSLWEKIIELRQQQPTLTNPIGFFLRMARNLCFDYQKHHRYQVPIDHLPERDHPEANQIVLSEKEELVINALDKLPAKTKEILILHYYSGYSFEEIAVMFEKTPNAIWTQVSRARNELKKILTKSMKRENDTERNNHE